MKVVLLSVGTRGDMEPFLAIGNLLKEHGDQVICAFPEQYRTLAEYANMEFASLGTKFIELLESEDGKAALGGTGSGIKKMIAYIRLARHQTEINKELVSKQYELIENEKPDRIVFNGKAIYPIIWELSNIGKSVLTSPVPFVHYTKDHTHVAFNSNFGPFLYKLTYSLANFGLMHFVTQIPYDWILPKVYGVIHHGGSGTIHLGLRYGCASMIIPHIIDQFVWNRMIHTMGAGPEGMNIHKITTKTLEPKILELMNNESFKKQAENLAQQIKKEDFREELYKSIIN